MFSQDNYWVSLCLAIITMITWGSNKIAVKYLTYPVAMYTIDYFTWVFIFHIILGFTMGAEWFPPMKGVGMISNLKEIIANSSVGNIMKETSFVEEDSPLQAWWSCAGWYQYYRLQFDYVCPY